MNSVQLRACANRRVAYVTRIGREALQSLSELPCAKSGPPIGAASKRFLRDTPLRRQRAHQPADHCHNPGWGIAAWIPERTGGGASLWPCSRCDPSSLLCTVAPRAWPGPVSPTHPRGHTGISSETLAPAIPRHLRREGGLHAQAEPAKGSGDLLDVRQRSSKRLRCVYLRLRLRGDPQRALQQHLRKEQGCAGIHPRTRTGAPTSRAYEALVSAFDGLRRSGSAAQGIPLASQGVLLRPTWRIPGAAGRRGIGVAGCRAIRLQRSGRRGALGASAAVPGVLAGRCPASPIASFHSSSTKGLGRRRFFEASEENAATGGVVTTET